jgi:hypothetical protein
MPGRPAVVGAGAAGLAAATPRDDSEPYWSNPPRVGGTVTFAQIHIGGLYHSDGELINHRRPSRGAAVVRTPPRVAAAGKVGVSRPLAGSSVGSARSGASRSFAMPRCRALTNAIIELPQSRRRRLQAFGGGVPMPSLMRAERPRSRACSIPRWSTRAVLRRAAVGFFACVACRPEHWIP